MHIISIEISGQELAQIWGKKAQTGSLSSPLIASLLTAMCGKSLDNSWQVYNTLQKGNQVMLEIS